MEENKINQQFEKQPVREMTESEKARQLRVRETPWWGNIILYPLYWITALWIKTFRLSIDEEHFQEFINMKEPVIHVFWHRSLFIGLTLFARLAEHKKKMNVLVSPSRDGAWLTAFLRLFGLDTVRGSTSRRGGPAFLEVYKRILKGEEIAITPDGPRGPSRKYNPGAALLAQKTRMTTLMLTSECSTKIVLKTWDSLFIPLPFSKITMRLKFIPYDKMWDHVPAKALAMELEDTFKKFETEV